MKTVMLLKEKRVAVPRNQNMGKSSTAAKRNTTHKGTVMCAHPKALSAGTHKVSSAYQLNQVAARRLPPKMKLQLFPLDETVRRGLEQDGHIPYLELILRPCKQIHSVLNHIRKKWGGSSLAIGEPILFPNNVMTENLANSTHWTLHHRGITAGDVYRAVGSPETFRLRYGWFTLQLSKHCMPPSYTSFAAPGYPEKVHSSLHETSVNTTNNLLGTLSEFGSINASEADDAAPVDQACSSETSNDEELRTENCLQQISSMWSDCLPNISVGGLFSEASLQELIHLTDPKYKGGTTESQNNQPIADSLDVFISNLSKNHEDERNVPQGESPLIFEVEATCEPFAFKKSAVPAYYHAQMHGSSVAAVSNHDVGTKIYGIPKAGESEIPDREPRNTIYLDRETGTASCAGILDADRSIGLSDIRWNDSLGPFDLAPSY